MTDYASGSHGSLSTYQHSSVKVLFAPSSKGIDMSRKAVTALLCIAALTGLMYPASAAQAAATACTYSRSVTFQNGNRVYAGDSDHVRLMLMPMASAITFSGKGGAKVQSISVAYADRSGANPTSYSLAPVELKLHIWAAPIGKRISKAEVCSA